jgi:hypothetical protein
MGPIQPIARQTRYSMESNKREIFNLLSIIFSGMFCAFALTTYILYYHGPTGRYLIQKVLLSPEIVKNLTYQEINPQTGKLTRFVFKDIEFSYFDAETLKDKVILITLEKYKKMFDLLKQDESLLNPSVDIEDLFYSQLPAKVILKVKPELTNEFQGAPWVFQEVQLARESPYYRVQLRGQSNPSEKWVYFEHPDIYPLVIKLLTS